jgi:hypothetical protein
MVQDDIQYVIHSSATTFTEGLSLLDKDVRASRALKSAQVNTTEKDETTGQDAVVGTAQDEPINKDTDEASPPRKRQRTDTPMVPCAGDEPMPSHSQVPGSLPRK